LSKANVYQTAVYVTVFSVAEKFFGFCVVHLFCDGRTDNCTAYTTDTHYGKIEEIDIRHSVGDQCGYKTGKLGEQNYKERVFCGFFCLCGKEKGQNHNIDRAAADTKEGRAYAENKTYNNTYKLVFYLLCSDAGFFNKI